MKTTAYANYWDNIKMFCHKITDSLKYVVSSPLILTKDIYYYFFNKTAHQQNSANNITWWKEFFFWKNNSIQYNQELKTIGEYQSYIKGYDITQLAATLKYPSLLEQQKITRDLYQAEISVLTLKKESLIKERILLLNDNKIKLLSEFETKIQELVALHQQKEIALESLQQSTTISQQSEQESYFARIQEIENKQAAQQQATHNEIQELALANVKLKETNNNLETENKALQQQVAHLTKSRSDDLESFDKQNSDNLSKMEQYSTEYNKIKQDNEKLNAKISELNKQVLHYTRENEELTKVTHEHTEKNRALLLKLKKIETNHGKNNKELNASLENYKTALHKQEVETKKLRQKVAELSHLTDQLSNNKASYLIRAESKLKNTVEALSAVVENSINDLNKITQNNDAIFKIHQNLHTQYDQSFRYTQALLDKQAEIKSLVTDHETWQNLQRIATTPLTEEKRKHHEEVHENLKAQCKKDIENFTEMLHKSNDGITELTKNYNDLQENNQNLIKNYIENLNKIRNNYQEAYREYTALRQLTISESPDNEITFNVLSARENPFKYTQQVRPRNLAEQLVQRSNPKFPTKLPIKSDKTSHSSEVVELD